MLQTQVAAHLGPIELSTCHTAGPHLILLTGLPLEDKLNQYNHVSQRNLWGILILQLQNTNDIWIIWIFCLEKTDNGSSMNRNFFCN